MIDKLIDKNNRKLCFYIYLVLLLATGVLGQFFDLIYAILVLLILPLVIIAALVIIVLMIFIAINAYSYIFKDILKISFDNKQKEDEPRKSANKELKKYAERLIKNKK